MTELTSGALTATWLPEHGMVGASLRHEGEELLGQRGGLDAYLAKGSAFGIPLLAPWANRLDGLRYDEVEIDPSRVKRDGNGLPKDGVMAGRAWEVERADATTLVASFEADAHVLAVFPFPHRLRITVTLDDTTMRVTTAMTATADVAVPIAFGWHPLFTLPGVPREELEVILPAVSEQPLDERGIPVGSPVTPAFANGPLGDRTADAEYPEITETFVLSGGGRTLTVEFAAPDYPVGHLWAPAGESFVAWEPMTAPTNALVSRERLRHVQPGETFAATFAVGVIA